jgi:orotidine-5'-phosphate decarboxylase
MGIKPSMTYQQLVDTIFRKKTFLCIGLDADINKIPTHLLDYDDPIFEFNKAIIDATHDLCVAYKPNIAFYEARGVEGWKSLQKTLDYIPDGCLKLADAKRGDIGNTCKMYAEAFFNQLGADAITVAPYMGIDSVSPFLEYEGKWTVILGLTSNKGSQDFQFISSQGKELYKHVLEKSAEWGTIENTMYVIGATHPDNFKEIREIIPEHFLLVPGVGAQGGTVAEVAKYGLNKNCGLLINSSRGIIYKGSGTDFADKSRKAAKNLQSQMFEILKTLDHA